MLCIVNLVILEGIFCGLSQARKPFLDRMVASADVNKEDEQSEKERYGWCQFQPG